MALWGKADGINSPGTVEVDFANETITGTGTSFGSSGISTGTVITIGAGGTFGQAVISGITSETVISIATTQYLKNQTIVGAAYSLSQKPVYTLEDANYATITGTGNSSSKNAVYGVDEYEAQAAINTQQKVAHAGWVGVHTYVDMHGNYRVKSEVLVAMSGITTGLSAYGATGDAADDSVFPDFLITFTTQPSNVGISTTVTSSFAVVAAVSPSAALTYQWQYASSVGAGFTNLTNDGFHSTVTTATLGIAATTTTVKSGWRYRAVVTTDTAAGYATSTSNAATLTYV